MMASCVSILSKRKSECLHAGIEKIDFESTVFHCALLANELIQAVALNGARAGCVGIGAVIVARRSAVKFDCETNRLAIFRGTEDQVQVAGVKAEDNFSGDGLEHGAFVAHFPASAQSPLIQRKARLRTVGFARIFGDGLSGSEISSALVSHI